MFDTNSEDEFIKVYVYKSYYHQVACFSVFSFLHSFTYVATLCIISIVGLYNIKTGEENLF